ncbi:MAG: glutathione S-transferase family protein [Leptospiraceae bacterium]|nr:glutathione S-transferase family protein [Leptospiraceae bacterium]
MKEIKLYGSPISNYFNKVKLALNLKKLNFTIVRFAPSENDAEYLQKNPMGFIPTIEVDGKFIAESQPILEFLEVYFPEAPRLMPEDPFEAARIRQIINYIEVYLDQNGRRIARYFFEGKKPDKGVIKEVEPVLKRTRRALEIACRFNPYIAGTNVSMADCSAYPSFHAFDRLLARVFGPQHPLFEMPQFENYLSFLDNQEIFKEIEDTRLKTKKLLERANLIAKKRPV